MEITYDHLAAIERDIENIVAGSPALGLFLRPTIDRFYRQNGQRIEILHGRLGALQKKYIQMDEKGKPCRQDIGEGKTEWKFLESFPGMETAFAKTDCKSVGDMYYKEAAEFLSITFKIQLWTLQHQSKLL